MYITSISISLTMQTQSDVLIHNVLTIRHLNVLIKCVNLVHVLNTHCNYYLLTDESSNRIQTKNMMP